MQPTLAQLATDLRRALSISATVCLAFLCYCRLGLFRVSASARVSNHKPSARHLSNRSSRRTQPRPLVCCGPWRPSVSRRSSSPPPQMSWTPSRRCVSAGLECSFVAVHRHLRHTDTQTQTQTHTDTDTDTQTHTARKYTDTQTHTDTQTRIQTRTRRLQRVCLTAARCASTRTSTWPARPPP
jgi:hypothetical protein